MEKEKQEKIKQCLQSDNLEENITGHIMLIREANKSLERLGKAFDLLINKLEESR